MSPALSSFWDDLVACDSDVDRLLEVIARRVVDVLGDACVLTVLAADASTLELRQVRHAVPDVEKTMRERLGAAPYRVGQGLAGRVAADRRPLLIARVDAQSLRPLVEPHSGSFTDDHPVRSLMIVPIVGYGELIGTLGAARTDRDVPYGNDDLRMLTALAERAGLALADAKRQPERLGATDYEAIVRHSIDGVLFTMPDGRVLAANPAACAILRLSEAEICRLGRAGLVDMSDPRTRAFIRQRAVTGSARGEATMRRGDGELFTADISSTIFTGAHGEPRASVIFRDVTPQTTVREQLEEKTRELRQLAEEDELTGLRNRRGFADACATRLAFAFREQVCVTALYLDIDDLKAINDTYGHRVGDAVIANLGRAIAGELRSIDVAARVGGDEFVALLYASDATSAGAIVDRILQRADAARGDLPTATFSAGTATREPTAGPTETDPADALDDLLQLADRRMYEHKAAKRGRRASGSRSS